MNTAMKAVMELMLNERLDPLDGERVERLDALIPIHGWEPVRDALLSILIDIKLARHWWDALCALWYGISDKRPFEVNRTVAIINRCLLYPNLYDSDERGNFENLVWSITIELKKVPYDAEYFGIYSPKTDPEVTRIIQQLENEQTDGI